MKVLFKKHGDKIFFFLLVVIAFSLQANINFNNSIYSNDFFWHLKLGELFSTTGLQFKDVLSYTEYGKPFVPFEWLFEVGIYQIQQLFGSQSFNTFAGIFAAFNIVVLFVLLRKLFKLPGYINFLVSIFYLVGISQYLVLRPTIVANIFFLLTTFLVLIYVLKNKNFLWITIPIMLIWENYHASFILSIYLLGSYSAVMFLLFFIKKEKIYFQKCKVLTLFTLLNFLITFLPPLSGSQYGVFLIDAQYHQQVANITEWLPLLSNFPLFLSYSAVVGGLVIFYLIGKNSLTKKDVLLTIPFWILLFAPYVTIRNSLYGFSAFVILFCYVAAKKEIGIWQYTIKIVISSVFIALIALYSYFDYLLLYSPAQNANYPVQAATFILNSHLKGNMYNDYKYAGYLLYRLYPQQRVFIYGRLELFYCCESPALIDLQKHASDDQYKTLFLQLLNRYHISFVITTRDDSTPRQLDILSQDPSWSLVYWDDNSQIFVRRNDKNDDIIAQYGAVAAQPYSQALYDHAHVQQAIDEYNRMIAISDSAKSRNILGIIYLRQGDVQTATEELQKAVQVDPTYPPPYVNLAYIAYKEGDFNQAMSDYQLAIQNKSDDAVPYITLGELYIRINNDSEKAKEVWQQGLNNVNDQAGRERLTQLLNSN